MSSLHVPYVSRARLTSMPQLRTCSDTPCVRRGVKHTYCLQVRLNYVYSADSCTALPFRLPFHQSVTIPVKWNSTEMEKSFPLSALFTSLQTGADVSFIQSAADALVYLHVMSRPLRGIITYKWLTLSCGNTQKSMPSKRDVFPSTNVATGV